MKTVDIDPLLAMFTAGLRRTGAPGAGAQLLGALAEAGIEVPVREAGTCGLHVWDPSAAGRSRSGAASARILSIAGSDSGGGAGVQADLKTIQRLGGYGMTAITAVTAQNTRGVVGIWPVPPAAVIEQVQAVATDIGLDAVKTGLLGNAATVEAVVQVLRRADPTGSIPLVVDPVMVAKGGTRLLDPDGIAALRRDLVPLATLLTPNLPEAEVLVGHPVGTRAQREDAARELVDLGAEAVLLKGGHGPGPAVEDLLGGGGTFTWFRGSRLHTRHTHGTGCTLSAAVATGLGQGLALELAVVRGLLFVRAAMGAAPGLGHGHGPLGHDVGLQRDPLAGPAGG